MPPAGPQFGAADRDEFNFECVVNEEESGFVKSVGGTVEPATDTRHLTQTRHHFGKLDIFPKSVVISPGAFRICVSVADCTTTAVRFKAEVLAIG